MEELYRIVFSGDLVPGMRTQDSIEAFSERFQVSEDRARDMILGGRRLVLKHDLDRKRAERYRAALDKTGLVVMVESQNPPPRPDLAIAQEPSVDVGHSYSQSPDSISIHSEVLLSETVTGPRLSKPDSRPSDPGLAQGSGRDPARCPKCGARQVSQSTGVCQACGVVVERYLSRLAPEGAGGANPYAPPQSDLTPPARTGSSNALRNPRTVSAGRGWGWIRDAWPLFTAHPWAWIGALLVLMLIYAGLGLLPLVGGLVTTLIGPTLTGGLAIGAHTQFNGGRFEVGSLFAGFSRNPRGLLLLGASYLGLALLAGLAMVLALALAFGLSGGFAALANPDSLSPDQLEQFAQSGPLVLIAMLAVLLVSIPLAMALFFSPYLVALNNVTVWRALKLSFEGCWRNILPFLVFSLVALGLALASLLTLGLAFLVLMPLFSIAFYIAYRDIYY